MLRSAMRRGFDIPAEVKQRLVHRMDEIVQCDNDRLSVAAAKVLVSADAVDVRAGDEPALHQHLHVNAHDKPQNIQDLKARLQERRIAKRNIESLMESGSGI